MLSWPLFMGVVRIGEASGAEEEDLDGLTV